MDALGDLGRQQVVDHGVAHADKLVRVCELLAQSVEVAREALFDEADKLLFHGVAQGEMLARAGQATCGS